MIVSRRCEYGTAFNARIVLLREELSGWIGVDFEEVCVKNDSVVMMTCLMMIQDREESARM
jgi:hypothetical protein